MFLCDLLMNDSKWDEARHLPEEEFAHWLCSRFNAEQCNENCPANLMCHPSCEGMLRWLRKDAKHERRHLPVSAAAAAQDSEFNLREIEERYNRFGMVAWTAEDVAAALKNAGYSDDLENVAIISSALGHHSFTDCMIEAGWEHIDTIISNHANLLSE